MKWALAETMGPARVAGFVYLGEEIESACFRLFNKQVISVLLVNMAFIVQFTDRFRQCFGELIEGTAFGFREVVIFRLLWLV